MQRRQLIRESLRGAVLGIELVQHLELEAPLTQRVPVGLQIAIRMGSHLQLEPLTIQHAGEIGGLADEHTARDRVADQENPAAGGFCL